MKNLYLIGGTMGVGKTTVSQLLKRKLPHAVLLDGDWCWDADPFIVTPETQQMVLDNITHLLGNFLRCSAYDNVIFCWVMHQQAIVDEIIRRLPLEDCRVHALSLICTPEALGKRLNRDIEAGVREPDVLQRSLARLELYDALDTIKLDVSVLTPMEAAEAVCRLGG